MGKLLHPNARTTQKTRREIYDYKESILKAAKVFNVNLKPIVKCKKRAITNDLPMGPKATVRTFNCSSREELKGYLRAQLMTYNFAKRLKSLKEKTPWQFILDNWERHPNYFNSNPNYFLLGLDNIYS